MTLGIQCLCVDARDPLSLAGFWQTALGWRRTHESADEVVLEPPEGSPADGVAPDLLFLRVPEGKAGKNRLHLDLRPDDQATEVARLLALGAVRVDVELARYPVVWAAGGHPHYVFPTTYDELLRVTAGEASEVGEQPV